MDRSPYPVHILVGPRGLGKTVLIGRAIKAARSRKIHTVKISPTLLSSSPEKLVRHVFKAGILKKVLGKSKSFRVDFMEAGLAISLKEAESDIRSALPAFLSKRPLLLLLDEAHQCKPEELNLLLEMVQDCMSADLPLAVILAGTPGLEPLLQMCDATYVERSEFLRFNSLTQDEAKEALEVPAKDTGLPMSPGALKILVDWSDNNPFFVQMAGGQAWDASAVRGGKEIITADANAGLEYADKKRMSLFEKRLNEIDNEELLPLARQVIDVLSANDAGLSRGLIADELMRLNEDMDRPGALGGIDTLLDMGFLWREEVDLKPGIPSLFDYVKRQCRSKRDKA